MPERLQRKRTKGSRKPAGAIYVGRPSRWANPFVVDAVMTPRVAVLLFVRRLLALDADTVLALARELRDASAVLCWCRPAHWCHADVWCDLTLASTRRDVTRTLRGWERRLARGMYDTVKDDAA